MKSGRPCSPETLPILQGSWVFDGKRALCAIWTAYKTIDVPESHRGDCERPRSLGEFDLSNDTTLYCDIDGPDDL